MSRRDAYHPLFGCQLKLWRAQHHADALQDALDGFLRRNPYEIIVQRYPQLAEYILQAKVREEPPADWSPIIGDIVNNWRSALDHLAWQLVRLNGNTGDNRTAFPIFDEDPFTPLKPSDPPAVKKKRKSAHDTFKRNVRGMHINDVAFIKKLQPYSREHNPDTHPLSALSRLSNWDKHREYQLTGQTFQGTAFNVREWRDCKWWTLYERPVGAFEDGTIVARYAFTRTGPKPKMDVEVKVFFNIAFGEGSPLDGLGIKETLIDIGQHVYNIIIRFKIRFDEQDFHPPP